MEFEKFFDGKKYYDPRIMINILEDYAGKNYSDIRNGVLNSNVLVTDKEIVNFLNQQFLDYNPDVMKRVNDGDLKHANSDKLFGEEQLTYLKRHSSCLEDYLMVRRYTFEPYSLEYFKEYISIVKTKLLCLLDNCFFVSCGCPNFEFLDNLDIKLDSRGFVSKEDIVRFVKPILYNLNDLNNKVMEANDLSTYLSFKMSRFSLYRSDLSHDDVYPSASLQVNNLLCSEDGYVALSSDQREKVKCIKKNTIK